MTQTQLYKANSPVSGEDDTQFTKTAAVDDSGSYEYRVED